MVGELWYGARYVMTRRGPLSLDVNQGSVFVRTRSQLQKPNVPLNFLPVNYTKAPKDKQPLMSPNSFPGFLFSAQPTWPTGRGSVQI